MLECNKNLFLVIFYDTYNSILIGAVISFEVICEGDSPRFVFTIVYSYFIAVNHIACIEFSR